MTMYIDKEKNLTQLIINDFVSYTSDEVLDRGDIETKYSTCFKGNLSYWCSEQPKLWFI